MRVARHPVGRAVCRCVCLGLTCPSRARVAGPLRQYAQGFAGELARLGYTSESAYGQMLVMAHLTELHAWWLDTRPEEAVIEARVEIDQEAERSEQVNDTANKILDALRSNWLRTGTAHRRCRDPRRRTRPRLDSRHADRYRRHPRGGPWPLGLSHLR